MCLSSLGCWLPQVAVRCAHANHVCTKLRWALQAGVGKKAGMTPDQVAIVARLKANNAQLNLRPELRGELSSVQSPASIFVEGYCCDDWDTFSLLKACLPADSVVPLGVLPLRCLISYCRLHVCMQVYR